MDKALLDEFIKYVKEEFDCDIIAKPSDTPDTFESIFGMSFITDDYEKVDEFEGSLKYCDDSLMVRLCDGDITIEGNDCIGFAA